MIKLSIPGLLVAALVASACSSGSGTDVAKPTFDEGAIVNAADWSKAETEQIALSNYVFTPNDLVLKRNQTYLLHLENTSTHTHTFSSDTLFGAIAVKSAEVNGTSVSRDNLGDIELQPGEKADLSFVAVTPGTYQIYCDKFMHDSMGMNGKIAIQ